MVESDKNLILTDDFFEYCNVVEGEEKGEELSLITLCKRIIHFLHHHSHFIHNLSIYPRIYWSWCKCVRNLARHSASNPPQPSVASKETKV